MYVGLNRRMNKTMENITWLHGISFKPMFCLALLLGSDILFDKDRFFLQIKQPLGFFRLLIFENE